jgi:hypothetical protein
MVLAISMAPSALAGGATVSSLKGKVKQLQQQLAALTQQVQSLQLQTGPQGPQGPEGPQGLQGPAGSADTPQEILNKLTQVDGAGSTLDADLLDGLSSGAFVQDADSAGGDVSGPFSNLAIGNNAVALGTDTTGSYVGAVATNNGLTGGAAPSEGPPLTLGLDYSATLAGNPALGANRAVFGSNGLIFEGGTADADETLLNAATQSAFTDRTITLPNADGEVAIEGNLRSTSVAGGSSGSDSGILLFSRGAVSNGADITNTFGRNVEVVDAWSVTTSGDGGSWTIRNSSNNAITNTVVVPINDQAVTRATSIDNANSSLSSPGQITFDGSAALDANIYVLAVPE